MAVTSQPATSLHRQDSFATLNGSPGLHGRTSSFSTQNDRSPVSSKRQSRRYSNASRLSDTFNPSVSVKGGLGNLADELDQLDDEEYDDDTQEITQDEIQEERPAQVIRDSGVDVSYGNDKAAQTGHTPFTIADRARNFGGAAEDRLDDEMSAQLDDAIDDLAQLAKSSTLPEADQGLTRTVHLLQDLGNQSSLEAATRRLTTSTNSLSSHLLSQSRDLQTFISNILSTISFSPQTSLDIEDGTLDSIDSLLQNLPTVDSRVLQSIQTLDQENTSTVSTLSQLTDTLQIGKHTTASAARYLRATQTAVIELRREHEQAEEARHQLKTTNAEQRIQERKCADECKSVISGFEEVCADIEKQLSAT